MVENIGYQKRLSEASGRVEALLEKIPALDADAVDTDAGDQAENEDVQ